MLRLYTTIAFKFMNNPLQDDSRHAQIAPCLPSRDDTLRSDRDQEATCAARGVGPYHTLDVISVRTAQIVQKEIIRGRIIPLISKNHNTNF